MRHNPLRCKRLREFLKISHYSVDKLARSGIVGVSIKDGVVGNEDETSEPATGSMTT